jgi:putative endonuclease
MSRGFTRYPWWRRWFGLRSERYAARYLRRKDHRIIAANVHERGGEIDLLTVDGDCLVIVEVRSTEGTDLERIAASITPTKQRRLTQAALAFLKRHRLLGVPARFDVVLVSHPPDAKTPTIQHITNAFEAVGRFQMFS